MKIKVKMDDKKQADQGVVVKVKKIAIRKGNKNAPATGK